MTPLVDLLLLHTPSARTALRESPRLPLPWLRACAPGPDAELGRQRGFTLLELMLAVALLSLILVMLWGSFSAVARSKVHGDNRLAADQEGRAIMWQLSRELRGLVMTQTAPSHVLLIGQGQTQSSLPLDSITLSTLDAGHRRSLDGFGAEQLVSYTAIPNPDHPGWFILLRAEQSGLITHTNGQMIAPPLVLAYDVLGLHLRYFDGVRWHESWDSQSSPPGLNLPTAVSIELLIATPGGTPLSLATRVSIPMASIQR